MSLQPTEAANTQSARAEYNYYSALIQTKKAEFFTAKYFRLCYFKSFCLIFTKLYVLSYASPYLGCSPNGLTRKEWYVKWINH